MKHLAAIGIDAGSTTCKLVGISEDGEMIGWKLEPAIPRIEEQVENLRKKLLSEIGGNDSTLTVATGYGRKLIQRADLNITEISCHARGVFHEIQKPGTLVDIGGQDSKVIVIGPNGRTIDFIMNDKCAAGTGRFLENTASRLGVAVTALGEQALSVKQEEPISSTCTVFAESEIISLIAHGKPVAPILRGLHRSLVTRLQAMIRSIGLKPPLMLSGGVSVNQAIRQMLSEEFKEPVILPSHPQLMGAYGAALIGLERQHKG